MPPFNLQSPFALAPMCDFVPLGRYVAKVGPTDIFHIEYTRVHQHLSWDDEWIRFINDIGPNHCVIAQLIGCEVEFFKGAIDYLHTLPIKGIDLNLGCPAPKVYKNNVGGGLLRQLDHVNTLVGAMREWVKPPLTFSVKFRLGFDEPDAWGGVLEILRKHGVDWTTVHLRTVADGYHAPARYELARQVATASPCPMLINGDVQTVAQGLEIIQQTKCWGVSIGRGAIRYPWIFRRKNTPAAAPATFAEAYDYLTWVVAGCRSIGPMKGYLNFLGLSVDPDGRFLKAMRQSRTPEELLKLGQEWLLSRGNEIFPEAPYPKLYARPSMERPRQAVATCDENCRCDE